MTSCASSDALVYIGLNASPKAELSLISSELTAAIVLFSLVGYTYS